VVITRALVPLALCVLALGASAQTPAVAPARPGQTPIEFWHSMGGPAGDTLAAMTEGFNRAQERCHVTPVFQGSYADTRLKLIAALTGPDAPTIFQAELAQVPAYALAQPPVVRVLDDLVASLPANLTADIIPEVWEYGVFEGRRYALPFNTSTPVLYYNSDRFRALGLPGPPGTWDEFAEYARRLSDRRRGVVGYIAVAEPWTFEAMVSTRGGSLVTDDGQPNLNSLVAIEVAAFIQGLIREGSAIGRSLGQQTFAQLDFVRGKGMMIIGSIANWPAAQDLSILFELGVGPIPAGTTRQVPFGGANLLISARADDTRARCAIDYWRWLAEVPQVVTWVEASYYVPIRRAALPELRSFYAEDPRRQAAFDQIGQAQPRPRHPRFATWAVFLQEALEAIYIGLRDPRQELDQAQRRALQP
jgi:sn-glycerol 3-phosphate transport system substrate-binding protein